MRVQFSSERRVSREEALDFLVGSKLDGLFGSFGCDKEGRVCVSMVYRNFDPQQFTGPEDWNMLVQSFMLLLDAMMCDIESCRRGSAWFADCEGMGWRNFSAEMEVLWFVRN